MDAREFVSSLKKIKRNGSGYLACCPAHDDKTPSLSVSQAEDGRLLVHCFAGCSVNSILSAMGLTEADLFNNPETPIKNTTNKLIRTYPYHDVNGNLLFEVCRYEPKDFRIRRIQGEKIIWGLGNVELVLYRLPEILKALGQTVYICEGEKDADSLRALGLTATTAPMGAGKWREEYTYYLKDINQVVLIPDCDTPGRNHMCAVSEQLESAGINCLITDLLELDATLTEKSDVSDYLSKGGALDKLIECSLKPQDFIKRFPKENKDIKPSILEAVSLGEYLKKIFWEEYDKNSGVPHVTTGFPSLDKLLGHTLMPGLYVLGAVSSLGKSAFCSQIADNLAAQGRTVLYFSLEMPIFEMVSRTLTRILFQQTPDSPVNTGQLLRGELGRNWLTQAVSDKISAIRDNIHYIEGNFKLGVSEIREHLNNIPKGSAPIVFVDYLQVLTSPAPRLTDKQAMDYNVVELKRISRDYGAVIFAISSLNRQNYNDELNFTAFKESGAIEYSADFVMGLQARGISEAVDAAGFDEKKLARQITKAVNKAKAGVPRELECVVLKNRRGEAMGKFGVKYWPGQNWFEER